MKRIARCSPETSASKRTMRLPPSISYFDQCCASTVQAGGSQIEDRADVSKTMEPMAIPNSA